MERKTNIQTCIDMHNDGHRASSIAQVLGVRPSTVSRYLRDARVQGRLPPLPPKKTRPRVKGTMRDILDVIQPDVMVWLYGQTPKGATVAETIAAIITDAYCEELPE